MEGSPSITTAPIEQDAAGSSVVVPAPGSGMCIIVLSYQYALAVNGTAQWRETTQQNAEESVALSGAMPVGAFREISQVQVASPMFRCTENEALILHTTGGSAGGQVTYSLEPVEQ